MDSNKDQEENQEEHQDYSQYQEEEDNNSENSQQHRDPNTRMGIKKVRNYQKVPENLKSELLKLVIQQGMKINQAAQQLNLKYATAKTIVFTYRAQSKPKKSKNKKKKSLVKVDFVPINAQNQKRLNIEISIGGQVIQQYQQ